MTELQAAVVVGLAENRLRIMEAARSMRYAPNTLKYHVETIRKQTGKDATDFYDMCELLPEAKKVLGRK